MLVKEILEKKSVNPDVMDLLEGYPDKDVLEGVRSDPSSVDDCGDTLFSFLYHEAHDMLCDPAETYDAFERARDEIQDVLDHIEEKWLP